MSCNSSAGASVTQEISIETEESHTMEAGLSVSAEVLGGFDFFGEEALTGIVSGPDSANADVRRKNRIG